MRLSLIGVREDSLIFGAVVCGDIEDDGAPVTSEPLAWALVVWALTGDLRAVVAAMSAHMPGHPWGAWVAASIAGWLAIRDEVRRGLTRILAHSVLDAATRERKRLERAATKLLADMMVQRSFTEQWLLVLRSTLREPTPRRHDKR